MIDWKSIAVACVDSLNHPERSLPDKPLVTLTLKGKLPRKGFPRPRLLLGEGNKRGERVYLFDAMNVLAALAAHGLITVQLPGEEPKP